MLDALRGTMVQQMFGIKRADATGPKAKQNISWCHCINICICPQLHTVCRGRGSVMVFSFPVFFLFAKRGLRCPENGFVQWLDDICQIRGEQNHLYTLGLHFLKTAQCPVRFAAIHQYQDAFLRVAEWLCFFHKYCFHPVQEDLLRGPPIRGSFQCH